MRWTKDTPAREGWYWWRKRPGKVPIIVFLEEKDGVLVREDVDEVVPDPGTRGGGEWAGPIPEPEDT